MEFETENVRCCVFCGLPYDDWFGALDPKYCAHRLAVGVKPEEGKKQVGVIAILPSHPSSSYACNECGLVLPLDQIQVVFVGFQPMNDRDNGPHCKMCADEVMERYRMHSYMVTTGWLDIVA